MHLMACPLTTEGDSLPSRLAGRAGGWVRTIISIRPHEGARDVDHLRDRAASYASVFNARRAAASLSR